MSPQVIELIGRAGTTSGMLGLSSGIMGFWLQLLGLQPERINTAKLLAWQDAPFFALPDFQDMAAEKLVQQYLQGLSKKGLPTPSQGVWIQSELTPLARQQGQVPLPAASLTKVATTLASLETWKPNHQFETLISTTGFVKNGVLQGNLIVTGSGDPLFVWEEAIALSQTLNQMGIRQVNGDLIVTGKFYMNFNENPAAAGLLLKQGLDPQTLPPNVAPIPKGTSPQVIIRGGVKVSSLPNPKQILLIRHQSLPLFQILKQMNIYSNNAMAEMLAESVGGATSVSQLAAKAAGVPQNEIHLVNGSGLGTDNQLSPRAVVKMFQTVQNYLEPYQLTIADIFPVAGRDRPHSLTSKRVPNATVYKTGTLRDVSALAGVIPTRDRGLVWFAIINRGTNIDSLRTEQAQLLTHLVQQWGVPLAQPLTITPKTSTFDATGLLGDRTRNLKP